MPLNFRAEKYLHLDENSNWQLSLSSYYMKKEMKCVEVIYNYKVEVENLKITVPPNRAFPIT